MKILHLFRSGREAKRRQNNAEKAKQAAIELYPREKWEPLEKGIFIAKSRMPRSAEQIHVLEKELQQARILVERGSTVYLLPEISHSSEKHIKRPDAVVDGYMMEFKTITGSLRQVEERYKEARAKAAYIFLKIDAHLSRHEVTRKLSGYIKRKGFSGGVILAYFTQSGEFYRWTEAELAANSMAANSMAANSMAANSLGQKNPGLATRRLSRESRIYRNAPDD